MDSILENPEAESAYTRKNPGDIGGQREGTEMGLSVSKSDSKGGGG